MSGARALRGHIKVVKAAPFFPGVARWSEMQGNTPVLNGALGRCPRCGGSPLFERFLRVRSACGSCRLGFGFADAGDGPAVFVSFVAGFIVCGGAVWLELAYQPAYWVHAAIWAPLGVLVPIALLRPFKGLLIGIQYRNSAHEGRMQSASEN